MSNPGRTSLARRLAGLLLLCAWLPGPAQAGESGLRSQVEALAKAEGFAAHGLEAIGPSPARTAPKARLERRLQALLHDYEYAALHDPRGRIQELRLSGLQAPGGAQSYDVSTRSAGGAAVMGTQLAGPDRRPMRMPFVFDAMAGSVVLSEFYIGVLGFQADALEDGWTETAAGRVPSRRGRLTLFQLGPVTAQGVTVAFVDDEVTGGRHLLGPKVLGRFGLTLVQQHNRLFLVSE